MIELAEVLRELRQELNSAMAGAGPGPVRFELGEVQVEATVAVGRKAGATGKVGFWVVELGADAQVEAARTHRISVTMQPKLVTPEGTHLSVLIGDHEADGER
ncbi:trypco2 family protein [Streptomyces sp. 7R007]